ncbi:hypothetical protein AAXE64_08170 [Priestia megaterium]
MNDSLKAFKEAVEVFKKATKSFKQLEMAMEIIACKKDYIFQHLPNDLFVALKVPRREYDNKTYTIEDLAYFKSKGCTMEIFKSTKVIR